LGCVFVYQSLKKVNGIIYDRVERGLDLPESVVYLRHLLFCLVDVIQAYATDRYFEECLHIFRRHLPFDLAGERLETVEDCRYNRLRGCHLFDPFIDAVFDEDLFESLRVKFVAQFALLYFKFRLEDFHQLPGVAFNHLRNGHLYRAAVPDHCKVDGDG